MRWNPLRFHTTLWMNDGSKIMNDYFFVHYTGFMYSFRFDDNNRYSELLLENDEIVIRKFYQTVSSNHTYKYEFDRWYFTKPSPSSDIEEKGTLKGGTKHEFDTDNNYKLYIYLPYKVGAGVFKKPSPQNTKDHYFFFCHKEEYAARKYMIRGIFVNPNECGYFKALEDKEGKLVFTLTFVSEEKTEIYKISDYKEKLKMTTEKPTDLVWRLQSLKTNTTKMLYTQKIDGQKYLLSYIF